MSQPKDPNQGEGDRDAARRYDRHLRDYVAEGEVAEAARDARSYVEREPEAAAKAEQAARRGPAAGRWASVDELVAKGHTVVDRVRPMVQRAVGSLRARFTRK